MDSLVIKSYLVHEIVEISDVRKRPGGAFCLVACYGSDWGVVSLQENPGE